MTELAADETPANEDVAADELTNSEEEAGSEDDVGSEEEFDICVSLLEFSIQFTPIMERGSVRSTVEQERKSREDNMQTAIQGREITSE